MTEMTKLFTRLDVSEFDLMWLTKSKTSLILIPESTLKIGAPFGIISMSRISGDFTTISFGRGEWSDVSNIQYNTPDGLADGIIKLLEKRLNNDNYDNLNH